MLWSLLELNSTRKSSATSKIGSIDVKIYEKLSNEKIVIIYSSYNKSTWIIGVTIQNICPTTPTTRSASSETKLRMNHNDKYIITPKVFQQCSHGVLGVSFSSLVPLLQYTVQAFSDMSEHRSKKGRNACKASKIGDATRKFFVFSYKVTFR